MSSNLFSGNKEQDDVNKKLALELKTTISLLERQKQLESNVDTLNQKIELLENNFSDLEKSVDKQIKFIKEDIKGVKKDIEILKDFSLKVKNEMKLFARSDDVTVLKKYIDLWSPLDFVTRDELTKMKEEIINVIKDVLKDENKN